jgi:NADPH:quinone reductase-like Zn-dependent oxidoreductase
MTTIRAMTLRSYGGPDSIQAGTVPTPTPGPGQLRVRVRAAGVNGLDWKLREGYLRNAFPLALPAVPGIEIAGVVDAIGPGVTGFQVGNRVMGLMSGLGAYAEVVGVDAANVCRTPDPLDDVRAAGLPVSAVTASQSLLLAGPLRQGQRVLVHGAAGRLGRFAVQLAQQAGAHVVATASGQDAEAVRSLGAHEVIDCRAERFEERTANIDLALDYVGGDVLDRTWQVLAPEGTVVSTASPDIGARTPADRRGLWCMMQPDGALLGRLAEDVAQGRLQFVPGQVVSFDDLPAAIERNRTRASSGKVVADFQSMR